MTIKRTLSGIICAAMIFSGVNMAYAEETAAPADSWNYNLVSEATKDLYADFPMIIDKSIGKDMSLSIQMQYLKNITENDSAEISVVDLADNSIVDSKQLSSDNTYIVLDNVENNKYFSVTLNENLNGIETSYTGYINTKFVPADFPVNIKLGNTEYNLNNGEEFYEIAMKKVGVNASCNHDEDEECTDDCLTASVISYISPEELNTFYSELDTDSYYELQVETSLDGYSNRCRGFISTYPGGENLGIFTRGYSFSQQPFSASKPLKTPSISGTRDTVYAEDFDFSDPNVYKYYRNEHLTNLTRSSDIIIKWTVPKTASYTIETVGNLDTVLYKFLLNKNTGTIYDTGTAYYDGGMGGNASHTMTIREGETVYYVLNLESGDEGMCAFRIIRNEDSTQDGISGYSDLVQANYDNGIFSPIVNKECKIGFDGDVNIFAYSTKKGNGYLSFVNSNTQLTVNICTISKRVDGLDRYWVADSYDMPVIAKDPYEHVYAFSKEIHCIEVKQKNLPVIDSDEYYNYNAYKYDFNFYDPCLLDADDLAADTVYGDTPVSPTQVTLPYSNSERTLGKGDSDWFTFTTGANGGTLTAKLYRTAKNKQYDIELYEEVQIHEIDPPSWTARYKVGTVTEHDTYNMLTCSDLLPNHTYYLAVDRPDGTTYSSAHPYTIDIRIADPTPEAIINENVTLTHIAGEDISDLAAMKNSLMANMTCKLDGTVVETATAINDVELYYNNSVLTPQVVNSLSEGSYTLTAKYKGAAATGGTITLTVSTAASEDEIIMLQNMPHESVTNSNWDWAAAAKILANTRLLREGSAQSTRTIAQAIRAVKTSGYTTRGTIEEVVQAANYFYSDGSLDTDNFINDAIVVSSAENTLSNALRSGQTVIMQLTSVNDPADLTAMRYIVLCGINLTKHEYIIYDPILNQTITVPQSTLHNGGYNGDSNLRFTGQVIEFM